MLPSLMRRVHLVQACRPDQHVMSGKWHLFLLHCPQGYSHGMFVALGRRHSAQGSICSSAKAKSRCQACQ